METEILKRIVKHFLFILTKFYVGARIYTEKHSEAEDASSEEQSRIFSYPWTLKIFLPFFIPFYEVGYLGLNFTIFILVFILTRRLDSMTK